MEYAVQDGHILVGRNDVDGIRLNPHSILDLNDPQFCAALEQLHHDALVGRVKMLDDDKSHITVRRDSPEEQFQRFQSARRSADADNGKTGRPNLTDGQRPFLFGTGIF